MSFNGNYFCISYSNDRSFKMCWFLFCHSISFGMQMKRKCDANHKTVKMKSRSSYTCQTDMYTLQYFYRPNIVHLWLAVFEELTMMKMWHKSLDREMISRQIWIHKHSLQCFFGLCVVKNPDILVCQTKTSFSHKQTIKFCQEKYVNY
jgi:hypothetical protein